MSKLFKSLLILLIIGSVLFFYCYLENKKVDAFKLRTEAMKHHISIVPGKIFSTGNSYANCIRISFGKPWNDDTDYGLMMLGKIIKKMI